MKSRSLATAIAIVLISSLASMGTTIVPMSVERLTEASAHVVVVEAADSWTEWNADQTMVFTVTRFHVSENLKGEAGPTITVRQMGGRTAHYEQKVAGVRHWQTGDQAVLFLRPSEAGDGSLVVTGLMQGDFRVFHAADQSREAMVSNGVSGVHSYDPAGKTLSEYSGARMSLLDLKSRVKRAAQQ